MGRFLNADALVSTGQDLLGNNMFAYCSNSPINHVDNKGESPDWHPWDEFFEEFGKWVRDQWQEKHYSRNEHNKQPDEDELMDIVNGNSSEWLPVDDTYNRYHRFTEGTQGQEAIYNKKYM